MPIRQSGDDSMSKQEMELAKIMQACSNCNGKGVIPTIETTLRQSGEGCVWDDSKTDRTCWACEGRGVNSNVVVK